MNSSPDVLIEASLACDNWRRACPDAAAIAVEAAHAASAGLGGKLIIGLVLTDDAEQRQLNRQWRGRDSSTNVLAFPLGETAPAPGAPLLLGDVVLAYETVAREAAEQGKQISDHLRHLVVHGVLHLLGFDHENDKEAAIMEAREIEILRGLGVADPYRGPPRDPM